MFRAIVIGALVLGTAAVAGFRAMPLEFALSQAGLPNGIVSWTSAQGTILKGRLNTVLLGPQLIGDVLVEQQGINPLTQKISYDVQWGSAGGRGTGKVTARRGNLNVRDLHMQQNVVAMPGLVAAIRELGGSVRILNGSFSVSSTGCQSADGQIKTDVLTRLGNQFGRSFSSLDGRVYCENGAVLVALSSSSNEGDKVTIDGNIGISGNGELVVAVETVDPDIRLALQEYGFSKLDGNVWHYRYQT